MASKTSKAAAKVLARIEKIDPKARVLGNVAGGTVVSYVPKFEAQRFDPQAKKIVKGLGRSFVYVVHTDGRLCGHSLPLCDSCAKCGYDRDSGTFTKGALKRFKPYRAVKVQLRSVAKAATRKASAKAAPAKAPARKTRKAA